MHCPLLSLLQYLDLVRSLPDYNSIKFPHCKCDARKVGHVIMSIGRSCIRLKACTEEGVPEDQEHTFQWEMVARHEADVEDEAFTFQYTREGKSPRWVRVYSKYVSLWAVELMDISGSYVMIFFPAYYYCSVVILFSLYLKGFCFSLYKTSRINILLCTKHGGDCTLHSIPIVKHGSTINFLCPSTWQYDWLESISPMIHPSVSVLQCKQY